MSGQEDDNSARVLILEAQIERLEGQIEALEDQLNLIRDELWSVADYLDTKDRRWRARADEELEAERTAREQAEKNYVPPTREQILRAMQPTLSERLARGFNRLLGRR